MNIRNFLFAAVVCLLFVQTAITFMNNELTLKPYSESSTNSQIQKGVYKGNEDLTQISGGQVIGMIPFALAGDFSMLIDGVPINTSTDMTRVDVSHVPGNLYTLAATRDVQGRINTVTATKNE